MLFLELSAQVSVGQSQSKRGRHDGDRELSRQCFYSLIIQRGVHRVTQIPGMRFRKRIQLPQTLKCLLGYSNTYPT